MRPVRGWGAFGGAGCGGGRSRSFSTKAPKSSLIAFFNFLVIKRIPASPSPSSTHRLAGLEAMFLQFSYGYSIPSFFPLEKIPGIYVLERDRGGGRARERRRRIIDNADCRVEAGGFQERRKLFFFHFPRKATVGPVWYRTKQPVSIPLEFL